VINPYPLIGAVAFFLIAGIPGARAAETLGGVLTTFDPYGGSDAPAVSEKKAFRDLQPFLFLSSSYTFTYRTGFKGTGAHEENHAWNFGLTYSLRSFLFVGVSAPVLHVQFIVPKEDSKYSSFEGTGFGDLATYVGAELPWFPVTITGMLMWPTGNREKWLGTGEYSGGLLADVRRTFRSVDIKVGGYYFLVGDPPGVSLPNTNGASVGVGVRAATRLNLGATAGWSYVTLITYENEHVFNANIRARFTVAPWLSASVVVTSEYYPVKSLASNWTFVFFL
jgi:hypothetical protein